MSTPQLFQDVNSTVIPRCQLHSYSKMSTQLFQEINFTVIQKQEPKFIKDVNSTVIQRWQLQLL